MNVLVTGGAGYIGSHTCVALLEAGHDVVIVDNLCNSEIRTVKNIEKITGKSVSFYEIDVTESYLLSEICANHKIDGVLHFAALKAVGESTQKPLHYYQNNVISTMNVAKICLEKGINRFVFSSSATVYGEGEVPFKEEQKLLPSTNPYAESKVMSERILKDIVLANKCFGVALLRYFNPIGAHKSGLLGEAPRGIPNNLMPYITQVAKGKREKLSIYGKDYATLDGTGVRDYIHVLDLADGHVKALEKLTAGSYVYNLGTGKGTSVLELINTFMQVNDIDIPFEIVDRRPGDIAECYAATEKAKKELGWKFKYTLEEMCRDSWNFEKNLNR